VKHIQELCHKFAVFPLWEETDNKLRYALCTPREDLKLTTIQILVLRPFSSHKCHIWRCYNIRNKLSFNHHSVSFISTRVLCFPSHNHVSIFVQTVVIIKLQALFRSKGIWVTKPCCRVPLITHHSMHCALMKKFASNQDVALRALCTLNKIL
jgi:hypothetical protein